MSIQQRKQDWLEDYIPVHERIANFYAKYPQGSILTEIIRWEEGVVVVKATIYRTPEEQERGIIAATGHAYEKEGSSYINKTSALENCESSAVGRGLALMGFDIQKSIASREEVANAIHQRENKNRLEDQIGPIETKSERYRNLNAFIALAEVNKENDELSKRRKELFAVCREKNMTDKSRKVLIYALTNKKSSKDLTESELRSISSYIRSTNKQDIVDKLQETLNLLKEVSANGN